MHFTSKFGACGAALALLFVVANYILQMLESHFANKTECKSGNLSQPTGVGKCPHWTSPNYWDIISNRYLKVMFKKTQNRTFTKPCHIPVFSTVFFGARNAQRDGVISWSRPNWPSECGIYLPTMTLASPTQIKSRLPHSIHWFIVCFPLRMGIVFPHVWTDPYRIVGY